MRERNSPLTSTAFCIVVTLLAIGIGSDFAQDRQNESGPANEHEDNVLGVKLGMDVESSLKAVFVKADRKPGQERPDALRYEGKDKKDVRVLYNNLKVGKLQIVFAGGKWVREITLDYAKPPIYEDLRLAPNGQSYNAISGQRFDLRYTIGYTEENEAKRQRVWYRDDKTPFEFRERIEFVSGKHPDSGSLEGNQIVRKAIFVTPGDEEKFYKTVFGQ